MPQVQITATEKGWRKEGGQKAEGEWRRVCWTEEKRMEREVHIDTKKNETKPQEQSKAQI